MKGNHFGKSPKNKFPVIEFNGQVYTDSGRIIDFLKKQFSSDIDSDLTPVEQATSLAIIRMVEEHLYFACVHFRWVEDSCFNQFIRLIAPNAFVRNIIGPFFHAQVRKQVWSQGIGRHTDQDILQFARDDFQALSTLLGQDNFFFGKSKAHLVDIVVFSMISMVLDPAEYVKSPLIGIVNEFTNLVAFKNRMNTLVN